LASFERFNAEWDLMQVREARPGPGRGRKEKGVGGFQLVPEMGMTIVEMLNSSPEHRDYALGVKRRLLVIVEEYVHIGVISPDELRELTG